MSDYAIINAQVIPCQPVTAEAVEKPVDKVKTLTEARKRCRMGQSVIRLDDNVAVCVKQAAA